MNNPVVQILSDEDKEVLRNARKMREDGTWTMSLLAVRVRDEHQAEGSPIAPSDIYRAVAIEMGFAADETGIRKVRYYAEPMWYYFDNNMFDLIDQYRDDVSLGIFVEAQRMVYRERGIHPREVLEYASGQGKSATLVMVREEFLDERKMKPATPRYATPDQAAEWMTTGLRMLEKFEEVTYVNDGEKTALVRYLSKANTILTGIAKRVAQQQEAELQEQWRQAEIEEETTTYPPRERTLKELGYD